MNRRNIIAAAASVASAAFAGAAWAQSSKPNFRLVVTFSPGGPADIIARTVADMVSKEINVPVIVENKPGAGGVLGVQEVMRATPLGYTLGLAGPDALIGGPLLISSANFDARKGISKLMQVSYTHQIIWAHSSLNVKTLPELIARSKEKRNSISVVSWGPGSRADLVFESLKAEYGADLTLIPYKLVAQALPDLKTGVVQVGHLPVSMALQLQKMGGGAPISVLGDVRAPDLPDVSTSSEQGIRMPLMNAVMWNMIFGQKEMPADIKDLWVRSLQKVVSTDAFKRKMAEIYQMPMAGKFGDALDQEFAIEQATIAETMQKMNLKPN